MAVDVANFIARNFNAPDRAEVDRAKYGNALMRNEVARLPQANQAQDLEIQARQQALSDSQKQNARGVLARSLAAVAQSPQPKIAAQQFISSPDFQAAGKLLGLPVDQFTVTPQDTDEVIRAGANDWANMLMGAPKPTEVSAGAALVEPGSGRELYRNPAAATGQNSRYGSPQIGPDGSIMVLDRSTGELVDTGKKASANVRLVTKPDGSVDVVDMRAPVSDAPRPTQPVVTSPDALAGAGNRATVTAAGTARGEAQTALPDALADIRKMRKDVRNFTSSAGFSSVYGKSSLNPLNYVPGSDAANARASLKTLSAESFGIMIQKMRGLGALSNAEGLKVTDAFTRATNTTISDDEAKKAWNEVNDYLDLAEERAYAKAGQQPQTQPTPANGGWSIRKIP